MNRKIKFRAWDTKNKCWLTKVPYLDYLLDDKDAEVSHHDIRETDSMYFYPSSPLPTNHKGRIVYSQWSTKVDLYGVEIYEGDVLRAPFRDGLKDGEYTQTIECNALVTVDESNLQFRLKPISIKEPTFNFYPSMNECAIIGNIFENPEYE